CPPALRRHRRRRAAGTVHSRNRCPPRTWAPRLLRSWHSPNWGHPHRGARGHMGSSPSGPRQRTVDPEHALVAGGHLLLDFLEPVIERIAPDRTVGPGLVVPRAPHQRCRQIHVWVVVEQPVCRSIVAQRKALPEAEPEAIGLVAGPIELDIGG